MPLPPRIGAITREYGPVTLVTALILLISVWLQVQVSRSPMTLGDDIWLKKLTLHLTEYPFNIRPFQSYATLWLHNLTSLPIRESFFFIQFTLALLLGPVFFRFLQRLSFDRTWSVIGVVLLMTAYPMLGAHYAPTHTWDDFWAYLFLTLAFLSLLKDRPVIGIVWLTLATLAREPIAVFLPVYLLTVWWQRPRYDRRQLVLCVALPLLVLGLFRLLVGQEQDITRWVKHIEFNFGTPLKTSDSIASIIIAFGFLWPLSFAGLIRLARTRELAHARLLAVGFAIALPLTVLLTLTGGRAIETRIFFPPFIFVVPLALVAVRAAGRHMSAHWTWPTRMTAVLLLCLLCAAGVFVSQHWLFPEFSYKENASVRQDLVGVYLGAWLTGFIAWGLTQAKSPRPT